MTSDKFESLNKPFTWTLNQYAYVESEELPAYLEITFGSVLPIVNAIQLYPYIFSLANPSQLSLEGKLSGGAYSPMTKFEGVSYENQKWKLLQFSNSEKYSTIKLTALSAADYYTQIFEVKFLVCNAVESTTITYPQASYVFNSRFDDLNILSDASNLDLCTASPTLPNGLVLEPSTCNIRGASTTNSPQTTYTTSGVQEGTNVIAFEVHRPMDTSSSASFVFDATGVFGVETYSTVVDSFVSVSSSTLPSASLTAIMDLDPKTVGTMQMTVGETIDWSVENLEGSK